MFPESGELVLLPGATPGALRFHEFSDTCWLRRARHAFGDRELQRVLVDPQLAVAAFEQQASSIQRLDLGAECVLVSGLDSFLKPRSRQRAAPVCLPGIAHDAFATVEFGQSKICEA